MLLRLSALIVLMGGHALSPAATFAETMTDRLRWNGYEAVVSAAPLAPGSPEAAPRRYELRTDFPLRSGAKGGTRSITEDAATMRVRTSSPLFDSLFALALEEVRENSVSEISDASYLTRRCECYETGRLWKYVWTRDVSYSTDLALAQLAPGRAMNSLLFKLSPLRDGTSSEIIQDTGSGGSWPVSTDRIVWALGAWELLKFLNEPERSVFRDQAYEALSNTIERDRRAIFDPGDGLYRGEESFLDWREQTYPRWCAERTVPIATSKALSTNVLHLRALEVAASLAEEKDLRNVAEKYRSFASDLRLAIRRGFRTPENGLYRSLILGELSPVPVNRYDLLGESLAILHGVAQGEEALRVLSNYPHTPAGPPVVWPQEPGIPIYHNRAIWPFVTAYALRAAREAAHPAAAHSAILSLLRGAALNLSNMENADFLSLANWVDDGQTSGPVVNSERQLWSVAGYVSMVLDGFFGRQTSQSGIRFAPFIPSQTREALFGKAGELRLFGLPYKGRLIDLAVSFPDAGAPDPADYYAAARIILNGRQLTLEHFITPAELRQANQIEIRLERRRSPQAKLRIASPDWRSLFAPRTPGLRAERLPDGLALLRLDSRGEQDIVFDVYRDSIRVAEGLRETTWKDPSSQGARCYAVTARYPESGNHSHPSETACVWPDDSVIEIHADDSRWSALPWGSRETKHGRLHFNDWGRPEQSLRLSGFVPAHSGRHSLQLLYGNAFNDVSTGLTAATKRVTLIDEERGAAITQAVVVLPHLASWESWGESSMVTAELEAGHRYGVVIDDFFNMSYLRRSEDYRGNGGRSGPVNRVNFSGLRWLRR